eukprot:TRINITY_DN18985_c0_g1_i1.p1 TRINITY_DN18985_c0_g1~~TRINITY_DN18985_c0_g1_i1.p1  ORF type:complete len:545 (-),score=32.99 TRINITY_DN18985_c0_g1_i1:136-1740(-)
MDSDQYAAFSANAYLAASVLFISYPIWLILYQVWSVRRICPSDAGRSHQAETLDESKCSRKECYPQNDYFKRVVLSLLGVFTALGFCLAASWTCLLLVAWSLLLICGAHFHVFGTSSVSNVSSISHSLQSVSSFVFYQLFFFCGRTGVKAFRFSCAIFWVPFHYIYQSPYWWARSFDGEYLPEGVSLRRQVRYSNTHRVETMDILSPVDPPACQTYRLPIVFVHGGAFVAVKSELELHSLHYLARAGHTVYSLDYPLAPEHPFPAALLSVLRALSCLRKDHGIERIILKGDSAGGCIVAMAAAVLFNPQLLNELERATGEPLSSLEFPHIEKLVCIYAILDQEASLIDASLPVRIALRFLYDCYGPRPESMLAGRFSLLDYLDEVHDYPPTFLIGGEADPIFRSTLAGYAAMKKKGFDCILKTYPATHAFIGIPFHYPLSKQFQQSSVDCMSDILAYLSGSSFETSPADIPQKTWGETFAGFVECSTLLGIFPSLVLFLFGMNGVSVFFFFCFCLSAAGFITFKMMHSKWPEHW